MTDWLVWLVYPLSLLMGRFCPWFFTSSNWCDLMCHRKWSSEAMHSSWWGARMASCWSPCWNTFVNSQILGKNRLGSMSLGKLPRKRLKIQQVRAVSVASSLGGSYWCVCFSDRWIIHFATWLQGLRATTNWGWWDDRFVGSATPKSWWAPLSDAWLQNGRCLSSPNIEDKSHLSADSKIISTLWIRITFKCCFVYSHVLYWHARRQTCCFHVLAIIDTGILVIKSLGVTGIWWYMYSGVDGVEVYWQLPSPGIYWYWCFRAWF